MPSESPSSSHPLAAPCKALATRLRQRIHHIPTWTSANSTGERGVVICAGAAHFLSAAIIVTHVSRENLPIEWYHAGDELCAFQKAYIDAMPGVTRVDVLDKAWQATKPILAWWTLGIGPITSHHLLGYMMKPFALMTTRFQRVLVLDADNFPLQSMTKLLQSHTLRTHHSVFWPEWKLRNERQMLPCGEVAFEWMGVPSPISNHTFLTESGTFYVDRARTWSAVVTTYLLNYEHDLVYKAFFGDKDLYYIGWQWTQTAYTLVPHEPYGASPDGSTRLCGLIQRHPDTGEALTLHTVHAKMELSTFFEWTHVYAAWTTPLDYVIEPTRRSTVVTDPASKATPLWEALQVRYASWKDAWKILQQVYIECLPEYRQMLVTQLEACTTRTMFWDTVNHEALYLKTLLMLRHVMNEDVPQRFHPVFVYSLKQPRVNEAFFARSVTNSLVTDRHLLWGSQHFHDALFRQYLDALPLAKVFYMIWVRCDIRGGTSYDTWRGYIPTRWSEEVGVTGSEAHACVAFLADRFTGTDGNIAHALSSASQAMKTVSFRYSQPFWLNFYKATFEARCNRALREDISAIHRNLFPALQMDVTKPSKSYAKGRKRRIGFISTNFRNHSVARDRHGIIRNLNHDLFDVHVFFFQKYEHDYYFHQIWDAGHTNVVLSGTYETQVRTIGQAQLDILVFCDIGFTPETYLLAHARMATVQVTTWGHSETSGISTIDYYVSSELYERAPEAAQSDYSEQLVLQRSLCTFYDPLFIQGNLDQPLHDGSLASLIDGPPYALCAQFLCKLRIDYLRMVNSILAKDPTLQIVFINGAQDVLDAERLKSACKDVMGQIVLLDKMRTADLYKVMRGARLIVDSYPHGGCNTSLEAFYMHKAIVTYPHTCLRGRFTYGFYQKMGIKEGPVAWSFEEMGAKVLHYWSDGQAREALEEAIGKRQQGLFQDLESVHEWNVLLAVLTPRRLPSIDSDL